MNTYQRAAVIGYWRSGATFYEIGEILNWCEFAIELLINEYKMSNYGN